jgi:hypothetical protein
VRHLQHRLRLLVGDDLAQGLEVGARDRPGEPHRDALVGAHAAHQVGERAVEDQPALVDDDDARAERGHVLHVVAGQQHAGPEALVVGAEIGAHGGLHRDVQADGRLVEEEHARPVQERRGQLALHPLAQRELPRGLADEVAQLEQPGQLGDRLRELRARHVVDGAVELEGLGGRQVPQHAAASGPSPG